MFSKIPCVSLSLPLPVSVIFASVSAFVSVVSVSVFVSLFVTSVSFSPKKCLVHIRCTVKNCFKMFVEGKDEVSKLGSGQRMKAHMGIN